MVGDGLRFARAGGAAGRAGGARPSTGLLSGGSKAASPVKGGGSSSKSKGKQKSAFSRALS